jgi:transcriptional regulator with XRE-family HTH domain
LTASSPTRTPRQQIAAELKRLREQAGLSQRKLAELTGIRQERISRLEDPDKSARTDPDVIRKLVTACGAPAADAAGLIELAKQAQTVSSLWEHTRPGGLGRQQQQVADDEATATAIHAFQPALVIGLLQTADYMRHVFRLLGTPDIGTGITARLNRQATVFQDESRPLEFLMTEGALRWRPCPPAALVTQLHHIANLMTLPNVTIGLIPYATEAPTFYLHGFTLYETDEGSSVYAESVEGEKRSTDPGITTTYRERLELLRGAALYGDQARGFLEQVADEVREGS